MGAINLDAQDIKKHKLIQEKQEMVEVRIYILLLCYVMSYTMYLFCIYDLYVFWESGG